MTADAQEHPITTVIRRSIERLEDERRWTTHVMARDRYGRSTDPESGFACRWCAYGAIVKESCVVVGSMDRQRNDASGLINAVMEHFKGLLPPTGFSTVNDLRGREAVLAILRQGLEMTPAPFVIPEREWDTSPYDSPSSF